MYNLPLPKGGKGESYSSVTHIAVYARDLPVLAYAVRYAREVDGAWLAANGYKVSPTPHGERYALFELGDAATEKGLYAKADVYVCSTRWTGKIDAEFFEKPLPQCGGKSVPNIFERIRPFFAKCHTAQAYNPVQMDFLRVLWSNDGDTATTICKSLGCSVNTPGWPDVFGRALFCCLKRGGARQIRTLSLFSGAGGLDIGFADVGFNIIQSVEIEKKFCETLELNSGFGKRFQDSKVSCIDIRKFSPDGLGRIDFIIGGPPCQTFSAAGRRANGVLGTTDARGMLFREYVRLLKEISPQGFLFENVYGITGAQNGEAWREIKEAFQAAGYSIFYRILDAADYGVPQHRERLIIVGLRAGTFKFPRPTHGPDSIDETPFYNAGTAVAGVKLTEEEARPGLGGRFGYLLPDIPPGLNYSFYTEKMGHPKPVFAWRSKFSDFLYKADPLSPVRTIKAQGGAYTGPLHWGNRFFALGEYKRLQTFPDDYAISGGKQIAVKQIGNSVPPQLARMLALAIRQQVFPAELPFRLSLLDDSESLTFRKRKSDLTKEYRGKASKVIDTRKGRVQKSLQPTTYYCSLSDTFKFEKKDSAGDGEYKVTFSPKSGLSVRDANHSGADGEAKVKIHVIPASNGWSIDSDRVDISVFSNRESAFTVGWKAFEQLITDCAIKADLIQLNGYYQYDPKIKCACEFNGDFPYGSIVSRIVSGADVAKIISTTQLSAAWNVSPEKVWDVAEFLRSLGYEIRNSNTNPQIPKNHWLVPYSFPTLTQRSVQLRKKIR